MSRVTARQIILKSIRAIHEEGRGAFCHDGLIRLKVRQFGGLVEDVRRRVNELEKAGLVWSEWPEDGPKGGATMKVRHLTAEGYQVA